MGITAKPIGKLKSIFKKIENEQEKKKELEKKKKVKN